MENIVKEQIEEIAEDTGLDFSVAEKIYYKGYRKVEYTRTCAHCGKQFMAKENKGLYGISWFADKVGLTQSHIYLCPYCFGDLDGRKTKVEDSFFKECTK